MSLHAHFMLEKQPNNKDRELGELYQQYKEANIEIERIEGEIENIFSVESDRETAEKIILQKWGPRMDDALLKSKIFFSLWLDSLKKR